MELCAAPSREPSLQGVVRALEKIAMVLPPTPIYEVEIAGRTVWCKAESAQPIGAFKIRGAWHRLTDLSDVEKQRGVVAFSSGNHAQGVAWSAQRLGIAATIVMPDDAPSLKVERTRALGAEIVFSNRMRDDRVTIAARIAAERGATVVPPFDDPWIIEGQGSTGLEAVAQLEFEPDMVVCPCGGGGLTSGLALALPNAEIVFGEPEGWDDMCRSLEAGEILAVGPNPPATACDALQTLKPSSLTFSILQKRGATGFRVSEAEIGAAMKFARNEMGLTIEPGGAVGLAGLLSGKVAPAGRTLMILSGGNVDAGTFQAMTAG